MKRKRLVCTGIAVSLFMAVMSVAAISMAHSNKKIMKRTHIVNLETQPLWFRPGHPIDFIVTIQYDGGTDDGFDVGVFHEGRLVGWETNQRLKHGTNAFRLQDANFTGDPGGYIVRLRFEGKVFTEKRFATRSHCMFTIDQGAAPPGW
jgi:hypothetical protein